MSQCIKLIRRLGTTKHPYALSVRLAILIGSMEALLLIGGIDLRNMTQTDAALDSVYKDRAVLMGS